MSNLNNAILKEFYCELDEWINGGCPHHEVFSRKYALCSTLVRWSTNKQYNPYLTDRLSDLQRELFVREVSFNPYYPFGMKDYREEAKNATLYTNQKRLNFIRSMMRVL